MDMQETRPTPTLLPQPTLSSPPSEGVPAWKDHPTVTPLDGYTGRVHLCQAGARTWDMKGPVVSMLLRRGNLRRQSQGLLHHPLPTLPSFCSLVFPSPFSHSRGKSKPLFLDQLCNRPDYELLLSAFYTKVTEPEKGFGFVSFV